MVSISTLSPILAAISETATPNFWIERGQNVWGQALQIQLQRRHFRKFTANFSKHFTIKFNCGIQFWFLQTHFPDTKCEAFRKLVLGLQIFGPLSSRYFVISRAKHYISHFFRIFRAVILTPIMIFLRVIPKKIRIWWHTFQSLFPIWVPGSNPTHQKCDSF